jgi:Vitamin K-dependent gamma-carboxylase
VSAALSGEGGALLRVVDRLVRPVAPAERLGAMRILVGLFAVVYLSIRTGAMVSIPDQAKFSPAGLAKLVTAPVPGAVMVVCFVLTIVSGLCFIAGYRFRLSGPLFAVLLTWLLSYRNSFGMIWHTENLVVMHVAILAFTDAAAGLSLDACRKPRLTPPSAHFGAAIQLLGLVTVLSYVLAGVAKLRVSGFAWATGDILRNHVAYDNLRKALLGDSYSALGAWAAGHAWLFKPFAMVTIFVELSAPLALFGGRVAKVWVLLVWSFHLGVLALMWILFPYQLSFVAFVPFFHAERFFPRVFSGVGWLVRRLRGRVRQ